MKKAMLVVMVLGCVCAISCRRAPETGADKPATAAAIAPAGTNGFIHVASILGTEEAANVAKAVLDKRGIRCVIRGGAAYSVDVAPADKAKAVEALAAGAKEHGYPVSFD